MMPRLSPLLLCLAPLAAQAARSPADARHPELYDLQPVYDRKAETAAVDNAPAREDAANLARLVTAFVQPPLAADEQILPLGERWVAVLGRAEQHAWVKRFLDGAFARRDYWTIAYRLVSLPEVAFQRDVAPSIARAPDVDTLPSSVVMAPGAETAAFVRGLLEHAEVDLLETPQVTQLALTPATIATTSQTAYVRDFSVEVAQGTVIADPIVDVIEDGLLVRSSLAPLRDGVVGISIDVTISDLQKPIPTFETTLGVGRPVTIQLPRVLRTGIETAAELPPGHQLLMVLPPMAGRRYLVLAAVEHLGDPEQRPK